MFRMLTVSSLGLLLLMGLAHADGTKVEFGQPFNLSTDSCATQQDMHDIVAYAQANNGDGKTAYESKKDAGLCGPVDSTAFGQDQAIVDKVVDHYHDADLGDVLIVAWHLKDKGTQFWGLLTQDVLDDVPA